MKTKNKTPKPMTLSRIVSRYERLRIFACIGIGMLLCILLIFLVSKRPFNAIKYLAMGPFTTINRFAQIFEKAQPMLITGCAFQLMVCVGNFSLINDSCVVLAPCLVCAPIILNEALFGSIPGELGKIVWIASACVGSFVVGGAVSLLPPLLKRTFHCNEIVTSSLLNSVFAYFVEWFVKNILFDHESGLSASKPYPAQVKPTVLVYGSRFTTMFIVGVLFCIVTYVLLYYTRLGFAARIVGRNTQFARASGINPTRVMLIVSAIAGGIAGVAGTLQTLSYNQRFSGGAANISDGMFCGIFAKENPLLLPIAAIGLSYLRVTAETMSNNTDVPVELVTVMTSFIIMMLAADQLLSKQRDRAIRKYCSVHPEDREAAGAL